MASVSGAQTSRTLIDILPQFSRSKIEVASVRLKHLRGISSIQSSSSRFPKLEECAHFHYDHVELPPMLLSVVDDQGGRGEFDGVTLQVTSGSEKWQLQRTYAHFCKLDEQLHQCVFDRKFSELPVLKQRSPPKTQEEARALLGAYVSRLSAIGSGCAISCGPVLTWFELDNRGRRLVSAGNGINTPAVAAAFATTTYTAHANDELSFQTGDMISVIDMPPAEESTWWRGKRGFVVGFFPSNCVAVITDKIPNEIALAGPTKPVLRKHGKLIAFFRAFILSRPSRRRLKQSGILRERVFGCDLSEHLLNTGRDIPLVLKCCAEFIEAHGIVDGIYRLSGVTSNIQRLRSTFDEDRVPVLTEDTGIRQDIHSVASLLKMYFRELPNPLCTYQLYDEFVAAVQSPPDKRLDNMRRVVQKLPPPHYRTLEYLMGHLGRVCGHSTGTGMTARNVAIVWAPNLLRCKSLDQGVAALQGVGVQAVVTEFLILYAPLIFGSSTQPSEGIRTRPKSLAVCTPTKLLPLHEAQVRGPHSPTSSGIKETDIPKSYHTILELPRKRQTLTWRAIFTPLRSNQGKSSHRVKHKNVVKSAEYLGGSKNVCGLPLGSAPAPSTHSRSVSHDSYFDTVMEQPSTSSLIDTQHEGLSLSLDLSELQMNFELEESEMKIFSEDETNQLFSSGTSIAFGTLDTESNLEQRFSNQELRYIDSYSPDPMEAESISEDLLTPGYQPLLTPNSYENLKVNPDNNTTESGNSSSKRSDTSPYANEKLTESPNADDMQKKESDLYESCADNGNTVNNNIYESMESEQEMYEPINVSSQNQNENAYENENVETKLKTGMEENDIYEEVQLSPTEIYEQVSYLRCSVEEVNRLVEEKRSSISIEGPVVPDEEQHKTMVSICIQPSSDENISTNDQIENVYENVGEKYDLKEELVGEGDIKMYDQASNVPIDSCELKESETKSDEQPTVVGKEKHVDGKALTESQINNEACKLSQPIEDQSLEVRCSDSYTGKIDEFPDMQERNANVPDQYECVNFTNLIFEKKCEAEYDSVNVSTSSLVCENKGDKVKKEEDKQTCDNVISDNIEVCTDNLEMEHSSPKADEKVGFLKKTMEENAFVRMEASAPMLPGKVTTDDVVKRHRNRESSQRNSQHLDNYKVEFHENEGKKTEKLRMIFEKEYQSSNKSLTDLDEREENRSVNINRNDVKKSDKTTSNEESEAERRERIEKYKEERRSFFRNKYKTDNINNNDDDDELIRRIKQKARLKEQRETELEMPAVRRRSSERESDAKKSPSKTTVTISYSPTRTKLSGEWASAKNAGTEGMDTRQTSEKDKSDESNRNDTSSQKSGKEG